MIVEEEGLGERYSQHIFAVQCFGATKKARYFLVMVECGKGCVRCALRESISFTTVKSGRCVEDVDVGCACAVHGSVRAVQYG